MIIDASKKTENLTKFNPTFYVGDPCYVISEKSWNILCESRVFRKNTQKTYELAKPISVDAGNTVLYGFVANNTGDGVFEIKNCMGAAPTDSGVTMVFSCKDIYKYSTGRKDCLSFARPIAGTTITDFAIIEDDDEYDDEYDDE